MSPGSMLRVAGEDGEVSRKSRTALEGHQGVDKRVWSAEDRSGSQCWKAGEKHCHGFCYILRFVSRGIF